MPRCDENIGANPEYCQILFSALYVDIMSKRLTNRDGFDLVVSKFDSLADMARALGVTRAVVSVWSKKGVPHKYIPELKRLTGLRGRDILPELVELLD